MATLILYVDTSADTVLTHRQYSHLSFMDIQPSLSLTARSSLEQNSAGEKSVPEIRSTRRPVINI